MLLLKKTEWICFEPHELATVCLALKKLSEDTSDKATEDVSKEIWKILTPILTDDYAQFGREGV